jgi:hypothetical protein
MKEHQQFIEWTKTAYAAEDGGNAGRITYFRRKEIIHLQLRLIRNLVPRIEAAIDQLRIRQEKDRKWQNNFIACLYRIVAASLILFIPEPRSILAFF